MDAQTSEQRSDLSLSVPIFALGCLSAAIGIEIASHEC